MSLGASELEIKEIIQIAQTWRLAGNFENAIEFFQKAISLADSLGKEGEYTKAISLGYSATAQLEKGSLEDAIQNATTAKKLFEDQGAINDQNMAQQLISEI